MQPISIQQNDGKVITVDPIQEYKRCKLDPVYFVDKYCYIVDPIKGELPFHLFDFQKEALQDFQDYQFNIVKKPRQMGLSWLTACYGLWLINFHNDKTILIISIRDGEAKEFKEKARYSYERMPDFMRADTIDRTKHGLNLENGSTFLSLPQTKEAGRSKSLSLLILDEVAFQEFADNIWAAAWPTLSTGGRAILISTTNGVGNLYHRVWEEAVSNLNDFHTIDIDWAMFPGRDEAWLEKQHRQLGEKRFRAEILCEFLGSGDTVLSPNALETLKSKTIPPKCKNKLLFSDAALAKSFLSDNMNPRINNLWIWEEPTGGDNYLLVADVGTGNGQDSSAFHVIRIKDNKQVAEYKDKFVNSNDYANIIKTVASYYNRAFVVIESNSWGLGVFNKVFRDETNPYSNIYITKKGNASWETTSKTRPQIIDSFINELEDGNYELFSERLYNELETFIWKGNKPQAMHGYNDDLVMSLAIATFIRPKLSAFEPMGFTSSRDPVAFKYDEDSLKEFQKQEEIDRSTLPEFQEDEEETELYDEEGYMTEKAVYDWLT